MWLIPFFKLNTPRSVAVCPELPSPPVPFLPLSVPFAFATNRPRRCADLPPRKGRDLRSVVELERDDFAHGVFVVWTDYRDGGLIGIPTEESRASVDGYRIEQSVIAATCPVPPPSKQPPPHHHRRLTAGVSLQHSHLHLRAASLGRGEVLGAVGCDHLLATLGGGGHGGIYQPLQWVSRH